MYRNYCFFSKTFGLDIESVVFTDDQDGKHKLSYSDKVKDKTSYKDLSDEGKQKIKSVLFLTSSVFPMLPTMNLQ